MPLGTLIRPRRFDSVNGIWYANGAAGSLTRRIGGAIIPKRRKARKPTRPRNRAGLLPGEYRRRGTVYVERLRKADEPQRYGEDDLMTTDTYNVITRRLDGRWTHVVEVQGQQVILPGKVVDQMIRHRDSVTKEQRQISALETHGRLKAKAEADQDEAERIRVLQGA